MLNEALGLFDKMKQQHANDNANPSNINPNVFTFNHLLVACDKFGCERSYQKAMELFDEMKKTKFVA